MPELLTPSAAAAHLNVSIHTLQNWRCARTGPAFIRRGRKVWYRMADIARWLEGGYVSTEHTRAMAVSVQGQGATARRSHDRLGGYRTKSQARRESRTEAPRGDHGGPAGGAATTSEIVQ